MNIIIEKAVKPYLQDKDIANQIQYAVNQMMAEADEQRTTTAVHTMAGTFYLYNFDETICVMRSL